MTRIDRGRSWAVRWPALVFVACSALAACGTGSGPGNMGAGGGTGAAGGTGTAGGTGAGSPGAGGGAAGGSGTGGCANPVGLYTDQDGDGYSLERPGSPVPTCVSGSIPPGHATTTQGWDCDDTDPKLTTHCPSRLVKDINQVQDASPGSSPHAFANMGVDALFAASDPRNGTELWLTDLTAAGTKLVVDLAPGPTSSDPQLITPAIHFSYFVATVPGLGTELWRTDGTAANTLLVADLVPGPGSSTITSAVAVGDRLYFVANTGGMSTDLWQTDGDASSTKKVDLGGFTKPTQLTALGTSAVFVAENGGGRALFRVGASGPTQVYPAGGSVSKLDLLMPFGPYVYYVTNGLDIRRVDETADGLFNSMQGWVTSLKGTNTCVLPNGAIEHITSTGSKVVFDVHVYLSQAGPGCPSLTDTGQDYWFSAAGTGGAPAQLSGYGGVNGDFHKEQKATHVARSAGGTIYFTVWTCSWTSPMCGGTGTAELTGLKTLWKFDGTNAQQLMQLGNGAIFDALTPTDKSVFWVGPAGSVNATTQGNQGDGLWMDGMLTGVAKANGWSAITPFAPVTGGAYLTAQLSGKNGLYFLTSGSATLTPLSTSLSADASATGVVSIFAGPQGFADYLVFAGDDGTTGAEPWVSDGSMTGTLSLGDLNTDPGSSDPAGFNELHSGVLFSADDGVTGSELWRSDGTGAGTLQVKDIWSGKNSSAPAALSTIGGVCYFSADDGYTGRELWSTQGKGGNTALVDDIFGGLTSGAMPIPNASDPGPFVPFAGGVFFAATQGPATNVELFRYDGNGSPGAVSLVKEVNPSSTNGSNPHSLVVAGGKLFFIADDGTNGEQLWVTDGTGAGTISLRQPNNPTDALKNSELAIVGQQVVFAALDSAKGRQLWASDGTAAGTERTDVINPSGDASPDGFAVAGSTVYFAATDQAGDRELWAKVGSSPAQRVADINPTGSSNPDTLVVAGDVLFFAADDGAHGRELCTSQGSATTTACFDIWPGPLGSGVTSIVAVDTGRVVLAASDGAHGLELWQSNGTAAGTVLVDDIDPGTNSSNPSAMVWSPALLRVFFQADDGKGGVELRTISLPSLGP